jgi:hypothetical protein
MWKLKSLCQRSRKKNSLFSKLEKGVGEGEMERKVN